ncbi:hypothetical protein MINT15_25610 [Saccharomonospora viridis]|uniref:Uncharacterized protein n=1 Tax=Saccharomonospora viridis TaxID=1852 RepID=A0A837DDF1_9PSEU|nr:hypothetical protein MINT15_25610 [Saccharomonospora viridis]
MRRIRWRQQNMVTRSNYPRELAHCASLLIENHVTSVPTIVV